MRVQVRAELGAPGAVERVRADAEETGVVDAALAVADPEEAVVAPPVGPGVLADPALLAVVVADDLDAVAADLVAGYVLVHAAAVRGEVLVDVEAADHRPDVGQVGLPLLDIVDRRVAAESNQHPGPGPSGRVRRVVVPVRELVLERDPRAVDATEGVAGVPPVGAFAAGAVVQVALG